MLTLRLYMLQRITALVMAPLVVLHLAVMIYAIHGGVSAGEILGRTQGSTAKERQRPSRHWNGPTKKELWPRLGG